MDLTIWIAVGVGVLVLAGIGFVVLRVNRRPKEEPVLHFNCPGCRQRLSYRARQAGHKGQCPRCKRAINFPLAAGKPASPKRS
jgi:hypothetical protein